MPGHSGIHRWKEHFLQTFEKAAVGMAHVDPDGKFIRVNKKLSEITGYPKEELLTKTFQEITHPDDLEEDLKQTEALTCGEIDAYSMEKRYIKKDGTVVWIRLTGSAVTDAKGDVDFFIGVVEDISERKQALRKTEQRFQMVAAAAKIGTYTRNLQSGEDYWSPEFMEIYGLDPGDTLPMENGIPAAVHPDDREAVIAEARARLNRHTHPEFSSEHRIIWANGEVRWVIVRGRMDFDKENNPLRTYGMVMDLTERKRAEEALQESEETFRLVANNISQLVWMGDSKGHIFWYNKRWFDYTGQSPREIEGLGWKKLVHPDHLERVVKNLEISWKKGEVWEDLFQLKDRNAHYRWFLSRAIPVRDAKKNVTRWFGTATDVTGQIEAEDLLKKDKELIENLLYIAAHDLKGPVANMKHALELVHTLGPEEKLKLLGLFPGLADQLDKTIKGVTDILRIRSTDETSAKRISFESTLNEIITEFREDLNSSSVHFDFSKKKTIHYIEPFMQSIMKNLIGNSVKYARDDVPLKIIISTKSKENYTLLRIRDNGIGIDLVKHGKNIFLPFQRFSAEKARGTGIGLYLTKNIIEKNGGYIEVESIPGTGTTFNCYLKEY